MHKKNTMYSILSYILAVIVLIQETLNTLNHNDTGKVEVYSIQLIQ